MRTSAERTTYQKLVFIKISLETLDVARITKLPLIVAGAYPLVNAEDWIN